MRYYLVGICLVPFKIASASVDYIDSDRYGASLTISNDVVVIASADIVVNNLNIVKSVSLENAGTINAKINVCDGCNVKIRNSGVIGGSFNLGDGATITQIINGPDDITSLGLDGEYDVLVHSTDKISFSELMRVSVSADKVVLDDANVILDNKGVARTNNNGPYIEIVGDVVFYLNSADGMNGRPILSNVYGDGRIFVYTNDDNPLFAVSAYTDNGNVYAALRRETDYYKILKNKTGNFLNSLRTYSPDDNLLRVMDGATTMDELNNIMSRSVRLNPIKLMRPIRLFNSFNALNFSAKDDMVVSATPIYAFSDNFYIYGASVAAGIDIGDKINISANVHSGVMEYADDINEFAANLYGANIGVNYTGNKIIFNNLVGFTMAEFDSGPVFDGDGVVINPHGNDLYFESEFGRRFEFGDKLSVSPYLGISGDFATVADSDDLTVDAYAAMKMTYEICTGDISYKYNLHARAFTNGEINFMASMEFWSDADNAGGEFGIGAIYNDMGASYQIRFGINAGF